MNIHHIQHLKNKKGPEAKRDRLVKEETLYVWEDLKGMVSKYINYYFQQT